MSTDNNDELDITTNEDDQATDLVDDSSEDYSDDDSDSSKSKGVAKILSQRNQARREKAELAERVAELEKQSSTDKFLRQFPQAERHLDDIQALIEQGEAKSLDSAYKIYVASDPQLFNQFTQSKAVFSQPSSKIYEEKSIKDLSDDELRQQIIEQGKQGKLY
jgi:hypothetical protein